MKYPWGTDRRYYSYTDYLKQRFGERVQKLTVNAGFTCPNRDGSVGRGGCTYCDNRAFNPSYNSSCKPVTQQLAEGIEFHKIRYRRVKKYVAYFQAYSNTYAPLEELKKIYQPALEYPDVIGIVVGTRPDCVNAEILDYFAELAKDKYIVLEYGIESVLDKTLQAINRGHDFETTRFAIEESARRGIRTGGHMIIGLPGEEKSDWMSAMKVLSALPLNNIKFHQLQIIKGTRMALEFRDHPERFRDFSMEEYLQLMTDLIEHLNPAFSIERIAGEIGLDMGVRKGWGIRYDQVLRRFETILEERETWQGRLYSHT